MFCENIYTKFKIFFWPKINLKQLNVLQKTSFLSAKIHWILMKLNIKYENT